MSTTPGAKIRQAIAEADLTLVEAAKRLERTTQTLANWIAGASEPRVSDLLRLAEITGKPADFFLTADIT